jgi:glycosyltransferase involved in cell wall biosynthesis
MAAGRPVILAIDGVIRQVIESADAGIAIEPGDPVAMAEAIRFLYQHREMAKKLGSNGRRYIEEHFDRAALADQLASLLLAMVTQPEQKTSP